LLRLVGAPGDVMANTVTAGTVVALDEVEELRSRCTMLGKGLLHTLATTCGEDDPAEQPF